MLNKTHRRWKKNAEEAIAPERFEGERERLATEIGRRIWLAKGGREGALAQDEAPLLALEVAVLPSLNDRVVQTSLALRYLDALAEGLRSTDYEDRPALAAEATWTEAYLAQRLAPASLGTAEDQRGSPTIPRAEALCQDLALHFLSDFHLAAIAAA